MMQWTATPPEWDEPIDEGALLAAEAAYRSAKRHRTSSPQSSGGDTSSRRRLPNWANAGELRRDSWSKSKPGGLCLALSRCRADVKMSYPFIRFGGRIVYSRTVSEVEKATSELLKEVAASRRTGNHVTVGCDIEWKPSFIKGSIPRKAAVMQLCLGADFCYVMHICHTGIPPILKSLLEDDTSVKVGVSIAGDAAKMWRDYEVLIKDLEELGNLANRKLGGVPKRWSLDSLVQTLTCKQLDKSKKVRMSNWEAKVLSTAQLEYAATDAYASWYMHQVLSSLSDAEVPKDKDEKTEETKQEDET